MVQIHFHAYPVFASGVRQRHSGGSSRFRVELRTGGSGLAIVSRGVTERVHRVRMVRAHPSRRDNI